jgi:hypothetical protein
MQSSMIFISVHENGHHGMLHYISAYGIVKTKAAVEETMTNIRKWQHAVQLVSN